MNSPKPDHPRISFITVNYNQPEVTLDLVRSLEQLTYKNYELILVDNGSESSPLPLYIKDFSSVKYLCTGRNLGFAGGNNAGLSLCTGDYLFFINNDTEVPPSFLEPLVKFAVDRPNLGMLSPKICFFDDKQIIQYAGATPLSRITIRNHSIGNGEEDRGQYNDVRTTAYIHGAAMMVPRKVLDEVGTMCEDYFLYYEEYDWCERIRKAGYEIWYNGHSTLFHKESVSTGSRSPLKIYFLTRNRLLFARRNYSRFTSFLTFLYFAFIAVPKNILLWLLKGRKDLAKATACGFWWNIKNSSNNNRK